MFGRFNCHIKTSTCFAKVYWGKGPAFDGRASLEAGLRVRGTYLCMRFSHRRRTSSIESRFSFSAPPSPPGAAPASDGWWGKNRCLILIWHNAIFLGGKIYFCLGWATSYISVLVLILPKKILPLHEPRHQERHHICPEG